FALDLPERLRGIATGQVLEVAAETGACTRALARLLPAEASITATDLNPAMLDRAKSHRGLDRVQWQVADALAVPFADRQFDCVVCQFGVMFFPTSALLFVKRDACCGPAASFCSACGETGRIAPSKSSRRLLVSAYRATRRR